MWDLATGTPVGGPFTGHDGAVNAVAVGGAGRPPGGHLRQRRPDGAGVGPGHRRPGRRPVHRPRRRGARGGGRRSWTAARWSSPAATTGRCGCGTWPPAPRSATRSPATAAAVQAVAAAELDGRPVVISGSSDRTVRVWDLATGTPVGDPFTGHGGWVQCGGGGRAGRPPGGHLRQQRRDGAGVGPGHRHPGRRPVHRPRRRGARGGGRRSWTAARWSSPAATTGRCGCGTWPPAPRSATRSPATAARCTRWRPRSWTAARWSSPAAATGRCGCGTWPPAPRSATRSPATAARCARWRSAELDGRPVVISGSGDGTVRVWDLATGTPVGDPFTGHGGAVTRGGGRPSWTAARWSSPAAATGRCGCGTWPPAPRSATRSPATAAR